MKKVISYICYVILLISIFGCVVTKTEKLSSKKSINSFVLTASLNPNLTNDVVGIITTNSVDLIVPSDVDLTSLIPTFSISGEKVTVDGVKQSSGSSSHDFTSPVTYVVKAEDGSTKTYFVSVFTESQKSIYLYDIATDSWGKTIIEKVRDSEHVTVWLEKDLSMKTELPTDEDALDVVVSEFENTILTNVPSIFLPDEDADGNSILDRDVDKDGKTSIVICGLGRDAGSYLAGYFVPVDFYENDSNNTVSNEWDALYINGENIAQPVGGSKKDENFNVTMAHEFQHLLNFSYNVHALKEPEMYTWIDEGMADNAGSICYGEGATYQRITAYQSNSNLRNGKRSVTIWENSGDTYSLTYMFLGYLRGRFGSEVYKSIYGADSANTTATVDAVVKSETSNSSDFNDIMTDFVSDLQTGASFPANFFPADFSVPKADETILDISTYAFLFSDNFDDTTSGATFLDSSGNEVTYDNASAVVYLDKDGSTWNSQNKSDEAISISTSVVTTSFAASTARSEENNIPVKLDRIPSLNVDKSKLKKIKK